MKSNLYWFRVGFFIGLGFLLAWLLLSFFGVFVVPFAPIALLTLLVAGLIFLAVASSGRFLGRTIARVQGDLKLKQGWADRTRR
jgi:hypothetical protein